MMTSLLENLNVVSFSEAIERKYIQDKSESYLTTIVRFCEENTVDFESIVKYISPSLRDKIKLDAEEKGWLKKTSCTILKNVF